MNQFCGPSSNCHQECDVPFFFLEIISRTGISDLFPDSRGGCGADDGSEVDVGIGGIS